MSGAIAIGAGIVMLLIGAFWLARQIADAPVGWQDRDGFHYGTPPDIVHRDGVDLKRIYDPGRQLTEAGSSPVSSLHTTGVAE